MVGARGRDGLDIAERRGLGTKARGLGGSIEGDRLAKPSTCFFPDLGKSGKDTD